MSELSHKKVLLAPLSGVLVPLDQTPDPVFAGKMAGDGIALLPSSRLLTAPCDGMITQLHASSHALTITSPEGLQILLHIGIETVQLKGRGFTARVSLGDRVRAGDALIDFDLDYLKEAAPSSLTLMVIANGELVEACLPGKGEVEAGASPALELLLKETRPDTSKKGGKDSLRSAPVLIRNPLGIHARPAAVLANKAKSFASDIRLLKAVDGHMTAREADAKSVTSIMALDVRRYDRVILSASGADAEAALASLVPLLESGLGENMHAPQEALEAALPKGSHSGDASVFRGTPASPGLVSGEVFQWWRHSLEAAEQGAGKAAEERAFDKALHAARNELDSLQKRLRDRGDAGKAALFAVHGELLDDPELLRAVRQGMAAGKSAAFAWQKSFTAQADRLGGMDNALLAARAADIRDIGWRVLFLLTGQTQRRVELPRNTLLIAEELVPSEAAELDVSFIRGLCTTGGSATSHVSLMARSMGVPAVAAMEARVLSIPDGTVAVLDGDSGELRINPDARELSRVRDVRDKTAKAREDALAASVGIAVTLDGHRIKVAANINGVAEAEEAVRQGGEGVGLLRSEFLFLQRADAPSEDEQAEVYRSIAQILGPDQDLVIRTFDVGGDKPLAYLPLPPENNPFLGVRGIRLNLLGTELFTAQVRAILRVAPFSRLHIMFPMVSSVEELRAAKAIVEREKRSLGVTAAVAVGIMAEVPATALLAENLAWEADFFSIGTNDLAQYALAVDRGNPRLAGMADGLHPAVLRLIGFTVEGAHKQGKWVGVCGGLASDLAAVPLLLGLGVDELSVSVDSIPAVKSLIRRQSLTRCKALAADALCMLTAAEVRRYLELFTSEAE